jgi:hypothetical protein
MVQRDKSSSTYFPAPAIAARRLARLSAPDRRIFIVRSTGSSALPPRVPPATERSVSVEADASAGSGGIPLFHIVFLITTLLYTLK